jgi:hypothetical protein
VNTPFFKKGFQSEQAEIALQYYIVHLRNKRRNKQHSAVDMQSAKLEQELTELKDGIITYLVSEGYWLDYSVANKRILEKHLKEAIKFVRNITDSRQVKLWMRRLHKAKVIEGVDPHVYKFTDSEVKMHISNCHEEIFA